MLNLRELNKQHIYLIEPNGTFPNKLSRPSSWYFTDSARFNPMASKRKGNEWRPKDVRLWATAEDFFSNRQRKDGKKAGIYSTDPEYILFKKRLMEMLNEMFPATLDEEGFARNIPVTRDFSQLMATTGIPMDPLNIPPASNVPLMKSLGLNVEGFENDRHELIFNTLFDLMLGTYVPNSYHIAKQSSSTFPHFMSGEKSYEYKIGIAYKILANLEDILDLIEKDDWDTLRKKYYFVMCMNLSVRHQPDSAGKVRNISTIEGEIKPSDKKGYLASQGLDDAEAMRVRTVYGLCGPINYLMSFFMAARRKHYFKEYHFTWHHTGPHELYEGLKDAEEVVGLDVTQMDQTVPGWFLDAYAERLKDIFDPRLAKLFKYVNRAPYYASAIGSNVPNFFMGDPFDRSTWNIEVGLASGRADNPDLGKLWMTLVYIILLDSIVPIIVDNPHADIDNFLKGNHPVWILKDMGDDAVVGVRSNDVFAAKLLRDTLQLDDASTYSSLDVEDGVAFLGSILIKDPAGKLQIPQPNLVSFVVNRLNPERGIDDHFRKLWGQGLQSAVEHYAAMGRPLQEAITAIKDVWKATIDYPDPFVCADEHARRAKIQGVGTLNPADLEVLADPSKRFYKFSEEDLSPEVLALYSWTIPASDIDPVIREYNKSIKVRLQ